jgi:hypothetical protein
MARKPYRPPRWHGKARRLASISITDSINACLKILAEIKAAEQPDASGKHDPQRFLAVADRLLPELNRQYRKVLYHKHCANLEFARAKRLVGDTFSDVKAFQNISRSVLDDVFQRLTRDITLMNMTVVGQTLCLPATPHRP